MKLKLPRSSTIFAVLDVLKFLLILAMLMMFIRFNAEVARQGRSTEAIAASTNKVVKSQDDILQAIKQVTDDTRTTAQEQTAIIICMLQVPIASRTTDLQTQCREQVVTTAVPDNSGQTNQSSTDKNEVSSSNPTPVAPTPQSNTSQPVQNGPVATGSPPEDSPSIIERILSLPNSLLKR